MKKQFFLEPSTPVQFIKGVGPILAQAFEKKKIYTVLDLLLWYPRDYIDERLDLKICDLQPNLLVNMAVEISNKRVVSGKFRSAAQRLVIFEVKDETGKIECVFFKTPFKGFAETFSIGDRIRVLGKTVLNNGRLEFRHPAFQRTLALPDGKKSGIVAIYSEIEGVLGKTLRKIITNALAGIDEQCGEQWEFLPDWIVKKYNLSGRIEALRGVHCYDLEKVRFDVAKFRERKTPWHRRLIFDEFLWLELALAERIVKFKKEKAFAIKGSLDLARAFVRRLPFSLTEDQVFVFKEIVTDMQKSQPMNRLLQGDVGCGKTVVAALSLLSVVESGYQVAFMAPTEVLAEQHARTLKRWLEPLGVEVVFLSGATKKSVRRVVLESLRNGEKSVIVGTHALISDDVQFENLGLVIIDEQHRFGVAQRLLLKQKGKSPHFLVMTATPIPRTLALTLYCDLDISTIEKMPENRKPIVTKIINNKKRDYLNKFILKELNSGKQVYFVYPMVEESESLDIKNVLEGWKSLKNLLSPFPVGLIHGQMKSREKDEIMKSFSCKEISVLAATTVIEVGVDVPNATVMVIENVERFGLSQLHQLRGRVGRGSSQSYCFLCLGESYSKEALIRAQTIASSHNGFVIAEADLSIRGPGEFLGHQQAGASGFRIANLIRDQKILQEVKKASRELFLRDPDLMHSDHEILKKMWKKNFEKSNILSG